MRRPFMVRPNRRKRICLRGHDKDIVGRRGRGCAQCEREREARARPARIEIIRAANRKSAAKWRAQNPEEARRRAADYRAKHPDGRRDSLLKKRFGISLDEYAELVAAQDGCCAICGVLQEVLPLNPKTERLLHIDHDHQTGKVRGLLCLNCNVGLGRLEKYLSQARIYLESAA